MKRIFLTLYVFLSLLTAANAGELYSCIDRDGNRVITSSPQDGMKKCVLKESFADQSPEEREQMQKEQAQKRLKEDIEYRQRQANSSREDNIRNENKRLQDIKNREADRLDLEAQRMQRGTPELDAIRSCTMTNVSRLRAGQEAIDCDRSAVGNAGNKRLCENDCANENLYCTGGCMGNASCVSRCYAAQNRCLSKCK